MRFLHFQSNFLHSIKLDKHEKRFISLFLIFTFLKLQMPIHSLSPTNFSHKEVGTFYRLLIFHMAHLQ